MIYQIMLKFHILLYELFYLDILKLILFTLKIHNITNIIYIIKMIRYNFFLVVFSKVLFIGRKRNEKPNHQKEKDALNVGCCNLQKVKSKRQ